MPVKRVKPARTLAATMSSALENEILLESMQNSLEARLHCDEDLAPRPGEVKPVGQREQVPLTPY